MLAEMFSPFKRNPERDSIRAPEKAKHQLKRKLRRHFKPQHRQKPGKQRLRKDRSRTSFQRQKWRFLKSSESADRHTAFDDKRDQSAMNITPRTCKSNSDTKSKERPA